MTQYIAKGRDGREMAVESELTLDEAVRTIREKAPHNNFANDLASRAGSLNANQTGWLFLMAEEAIARSKAQEERIAEREQVVETEVLTEDFTALAAIFEHAATTGRLIRPTVLLQTSGGKTVVLKRAGDRARNPGSIGVTDDRRYPDNTWYGRIDPDGKWSRGKDADDDILDILRRFSADPQGIAADYGRKTGRCCFCRIRLTDERSVLQGYGPICARKFGLPWGERPAPRMPVVLPAPGEMATV